MNDLSIIKNRDNYLYFLKLFSEYNDCEYSENINYEYFNIDNDVGLLNIFNKYKLDRIVYDNNGFIGALKLLEWTFNHLLSNEYGDYKGQYYANDILEYSKSNRITLNCLCHATVLTELLLATGYKAKKVYCLSCDVMPSENHVVAEVYINELNKWVMLDPTISGYLVDLNDMPLSIDDIRKNLISNHQMKIIYFNRFGGKINISQRLSFDREGYFAYLCKDFFRFVVCTKQNTLYQPNQGIYNMLVPNKYLTYKKQLYNYAGYQGVVNITTNRKSFWG